METIVFAACIHNNQIWRGRRHHLILKEIGEKPNGPQGFVTSTGRFVDRKEAATIAYKAKQISELKEKLFSEDLW